MSHLRVVLALSALLVAGCSTPEDEGASPAAATNELQAGGGVELPEGTPPASGAPATDVPVWQVGDAWTIVTHGDDGEETSTLVVTSAEGGKYVVETTSERIAGWDAIFDVSYVGDIRASDLAGHQQGAPVEYFSFPLQDGKTWTTSWDGLEVSLKATKSPRGFAIVGTAEGAPYVEYDYAPDLKWFSKIEFVRDGYGLTVSRLETGWAGTLATGVSNVVYEGAPSAPVASPNSGAFTVTEGQTRVVALHRGGGQQFLSNVLFVDPGGQPQTGTFDAEFAGGHQVFATYDLSPTPGDWHVSAPGIHDPTGGFWLTIHEVAITTRAFPA